MFIKPIVIGVALQSLPLMLLGLLSPLTEGGDTVSQYLLSYSTLAIVALGSLLIGFIPLIRGCIPYAKAKGYPAFLGWVGVFSWFGISLLVLLPDRSHNLESGPIDDSPKKVFARINLWGILVRFIAIATLYIIPIALIAQLSGQSLANVQENEQLGNLTCIILKIHFAIILLRIFRTAQLDLPAVFGFKNKLNSQHIILTLLSTVALFVFSSSFNRIVLYGLSYTFSGYVEYYFENSQTFTNIPGFILACFASILLAPLLEEVIFRGVILQKWVLRWGGRWGIIASSLLFAIMHLRFDVVSIFLGGVFMSLLYVRTSNLMAPMLCHGLFNATSVIWTAIIVFGQSEIERETAISVSDFQTMVSPRLDQYIVLAIISASFLLYLLYKLMPRQSETIPYLNNCSPRETP